MLTEKRERAKPPAWYESQWTFLWTVVGSILMAGAISALTGIMVVWLMAQGIRLNFESEKPRRVPVEQRLEQRMQERVREAWTPQSRTEVINHPPKTVNACMQESGGIVNETFKRCRAGWSETRVTMEGTVSR